MTTEASLGEQVTHSVNGWSRNNTPVNTRGGQERHPVWVKTIGRKLNYFQVGI